MHVLAPKTPSICEFTQNSTDYFTIISNDDSPHRAFNVFCKKVNVFALYKHEYYNEKEDFQFKVGLGVKL